MVHRIIVDSGDPAISYSYAPGKYWIPGNDSYTYGTTYTHGTASASLNLTFEGTEIQAFGQVAEPLYCSYEIDSTQSGGSTGVSNPSYSAAKTGLEWFNLTGLSSGSHNLSLTLVGADAILDYLVITPSTNMSLDGYTLVVDDNETDVVFSGNWTVQSRQSYGYGFPFNNTLTGTGDNSSTVEFNFTGVSVSVYGAVHSAAGASSYSVDGSPATNYTPPSNLTDDSWYLHQQFFHAELEQGNHTLLISVPSLSGRERFWLDYILYGPTTSTNITHFPGASTIPTSPSSTDEESSLNVGALVGGCIGGVVLICIIFAVLRCRKVRAKKAAYSIPVPSSNYRPEYYEGIENQNSLMFDVPTAAAIRQREAEMYNQLSTHPRSPSTTSPTESWPLVNYDPPRVTDATVPVQTEISVLQREIESLRAENEELQIIGAADPPPYTESPARP
ncbi:uncharacterized protein EV420DRAFT_1496069 [Desarmillaria tabescens]|uniref:Uncharacterized protein n=1 Tax=Armillaria tabescens TaxID=1929756 RepID=A0AA39NQ80_ARMTA|nr:uncharacterized protein EV420DRAFT_1496069 [Desarmillaria tabescens]KAK0469685.1 hypothetical protein EV420DRAFT_1496069 [Desarmillaria tabescens]